MFQTKVMIKEVGELKAYYKRENGQYLANPVSGELIVDGH